jgi:hypothetical protein
MRIAAVSSRPCDVPPVRYDGTDELITLEFGSPATAVICGHPMRRSWTRPIGGSTSSRTVRDLVVGSDITVENRGRHRLKGVKAPGRSSPWRALTRRPGVSDLASDLGAHLPSCRVPFDSGAAAQAKLVSFACVGQGGSPASRLAATSRSLQAWH